MAKRRSNSKDSQGDDDRDDDFNDDDNADEDEETQQEFDDFKKWLDQNSPTRSSPAVALAPPPADVACAKCKETPCK